MKKIFLALLVAILGIQMQAKDGSLLPFTNVVEAEWKKSETGIWTDGNKTMFKLDPKDQTAWMSYSGDKWARAEDDSWGDIQGKWFKLINKKLMWWALPVDESIPGKWEVSKEGYWQGGDGQWYKFDANLNLLVAPAESIER